MDEENPQYPRPTAPLSLSEVIRRIVGEPDYADFIRGEVQRALTAPTQQEREEAASNIDAYFTLSDEELTRLNFGVPTCMISAPSCTATRANIRLLSAALTPPG